MTDIKWTQEGDGPAWKSESLADSKPLGDACRRLLAEDIRVGNTLTSVAIACQFRDEVDRLRARNRKLDAVVRSVIPDIEEWDPVIAAELRDAIEENADGE
jgi:hypothetical protein